MKVKFEFEIEHLTEVNKLLQIAEKNRVGALIVALALLGPLATWWLLR